MIWLICGCAILHDRIIAFSAETVEDWVPFNPFTISQRVLDATRLNGFWVTVGEGGTVLNSDDGLFLPQAESSIQVPLKQVLYGDRWLTVGGHTYLLQSQYGIKRNAKPPPGQIQSIGFGSEQSIAIGDQSIWYSMEANLVPGTNELTSRS